MDYADPGIFVARTDTIILATVVPLDPYVGLVSIPRDLWVTIPGVGENRINTAHFFAEATQQGTGPYAAMETIEYNFGIDLDYYVRFRFESFREIVNAMGTVEITLTEPMAGYAPGTYELKGRKALAFVRNREGTDDFARMQQAQLMIKAIFNTLLKPRNWIKVPAVFKAFINSVDTNIPSWQMPRLGLALLRSGPDGIDNHRITREMVTPFTTNEGASVLLPNWDLINPLIRQVFQEYR